jgi:putative transposase
VADALRHAFVTHGVCLIYYGDNGSGQKNKHLDHPLTGIFSRLDVRHETGIPRNSQGRGLMERAHQSILIRAARGLATYSGKDMDKDARNEVFRITRKEIKDAGVSRTLPSWRQFLDAVAAAIAEYNATPHSALPKFTDAEGRLRHYSPDEYWALRAGENPVLEVLAPDEAQDYFRPHRVATVRRCVIRLFNNEYFASALKDLHDEQVQVGFDIHDASSVLVRDLDGRFICEAKWDGNKHDYFPVSVVEQQQEKRMRGRLARVDAKRDEILAEGNARPALEHQPAQSIPVLVPPVQQAAELPPDLKAFKALQDARRAAELAAEPAPEPEQHATVVELMSMSPEGRFNRWLSLSQRFQQGEHLYELDENPRLRMFLVSYPQSIEGKVMIGRYEASKKAECVTAGTATHSYSV